MYNDELYHYGVKGMRWGVRRDRDNSDGGSGGSGGPRRSMSAEDANKLKKQVNKNREALENASGQRESKKKSAARAAAREQADEQMKKMSDKELRERVNRLNMEQQYTQLVENRAVRDIGESKVDRYMDMSIKALKFAGVALSVYATVKDLQK